MLAASAEAGMKRHPIFSKLAALGVAYEGLPIASVLLTMKGGLS